MIELLAAGTTGALASEASNTLAKLASEASNTLAKLASEASNNFGDTRNGGLAGPTGFVIILLLVVGTVLLIRNMNARLRRLPGSFEQQQQHPPQEQPAAAAEDDEQPGPV